MAYPCIRLLRFAPSFGSPGACLLVAERVEKVHGLVAVFVNRRLSQGFQFKSNFQWFGAARARHYTKVDTDDTG
jgi:hypothetical protein